MILDKNTAIKMKKLLLILTLIPLLGLSQVSYQYLKGQTEERVKDYEAIVRDNDGKFYSEDSYKNVNAFYMQSVGSEMMDSVKFMWFAESASAKEDNRFAEIYDMSGLENNGTQTTESAQPYVTNDWIPSGHEAMKNPNGDTRYITHPEISFAADEAWSVTTVLDWDGQSSSTYYAGNGSTSSSSVALRSVGVNRFVLRNKSGVIGSSSIFNNQIIGKGSIITWVASGFDNVDVEYKIVEEDTYAIVKDKIPEGKTTCSLCSRLRRAVLYKAASELKATKIALGHHRDDMIETLMLNMFYGGKIKAMPAKLVSDNGQHVVIRPLAFCKESDLIQYAKLKDFPIIPCNLCGSQPNLQRQNIKQMLNTWAEESPGRIESIFTSMKNIVPSHMCDGELFDFKSINSSSEVVNGGDTAFDTEEFKEPNVANNQHRQNDGLNIVNLS